MAKSLVRRPAAVDWSVLEDEDSGASASPVAAAIAAATAQVSARVKAAAQKKPSAARRVSFAPLPEPPKSRDAGRAVSPVRLAPARGSAGPIAAEEEWNPAWGAPLTNEWDGRDDGTIVEQMESGTVSWGDVFFPPGCVLPEPKIVVESAAPRANTWDDFLEQPWHDKLREQWSDFYVTEDLTDEEWETMMSWFYQAGWYIREWCREYIDVDPDDEPPRTFIPPRVLEELAAEDAKLTRRGYSRKCSAGHHHHHRAVAALAEGAETAAAPAPAPAAPREKKQKPAAAPIPRFCRAAGACAEAGCRFTHGDTIPVQNKVCAFDGRCAGDKRATCVFLHPSEGEVWTAELVRHRPVAAAAAGTE
jgi:hypothetical protein